MDCKNRIIKLRESTGLNRKDFCKLVHIPYRTMTELAKVKSNLKSVVGSGIKSKSRSTGELERSLGLSPVMVDKNGNHDIKVGFSEPRTDGGSNAKIANILEYGTSGQSAKPFLKPAKSAVKKQCVEAMKSAFEKEVEGL